MHGEPKYGPDFSHFDYVNPTAPKGGVLALSRTGTFDSVNPFIIRGVPAAGLGQSYQSLLQRSWDEPFTLYALLAERVEMPADRRWVAFTIRDSARFHDGSPVTVDDVIFSYETLRAKGRPNHRFYYGQVSEVERIGQRGVRFHFPATDNRELPLILGLMPIVPERRFADTPFDRVTLTPIAGSGPYRIDKIDAGRRIVYRRIPGHWSETLPAGRGQHNFDTIRYDYYRDADAAFQAFQAGDVRWREEPDPKRWVTGYDFPAAGRREVARAAVPHGRPAGMYALVFNTRRPPFDDIRVRDALTHAFDFDWINRTFFHGAYRRTTSYFANSELAASGPPGERESALLRPWRGSLPAEVFAAAYKPPGTDGGRRRALRVARERLAAAGWRVKALRLTKEDTGQPLRLAIMLQHRREERVALNFARNLERLGIAVSVDMVDPAQYQERLSSFDFDMIFYHWAQSLSPGNEQAFYWSSDAARRPGSRNYAGIGSATVDALITRLTSAKTRQDLVLATRALDRVLTWGQYVIPLYHLDADRIAYWNRFGWPERTPLYGVRLETWWEDPAKAARLGGR